MALNTVTLQWDLTDLIQAGVSATLSITPTAQLSDSTDHILIPPVARTYTFTGGAGQLAGIVANDNSSLLPANSGYLISVTSAAGHIIVPQFQTQILFSNGATQWLDALAPVASVATSYQYLPLPSGTATAGYVPVATGSGEASAWTAVGGSGTVTTVSVATANGFAGTVANATTTPAVTVSTSVTGLLKGNGTAVSAATPGTDYVAPAGNAATATNLAGGATLPAYLAPHVVTLSFVGSGTTLVDASLGNAFNLTLTASTTTLGSPSNSVDGEVIRFRITQGGSGSFTLAYGGTYDFGTTGAPVLSTAAAKVDILGFEYVASISKWCYLGSGLGF